MVDQFDVLFKELLKWRKEIDDKYKIPPEEEIRYSSIVPLVGFDCSKNIILLDERTAIQRINEHQINKMLNDIIDDKPIAWGCFDTALKNVKYALVRMISSSQVYGPSWQTYGETIEHQMWDETSPIITFDILTALRLLKAGSVKTCTAFLIDMTNGFCHDVSNRGPTIRFSAYDLHFSNYFLKDEQTIKLRQFFDFLNRIATKEYKIELFMHPETEMSHPLGFALRQFRKIYEDSEIENMAISIWNAFEDLSKNPAFRWHGKFLPYRASKGETVSYAIANLLSIDKEDQNLMQGEIKKFYETVRCAKGVAHGGYGSIDFRSPESINLLRECEEFLRLALQKLFLPTAHQLKTKK